MQLSDVWVALEGIKVIACISHFFFYKEVLATKLVGEEK